MEKASNTRKNFKKIFIQFIKFGIVGAVNTFLSYGITNLGYYAFHFHEQICNLIAFIITVFISYILNSKFVFNENNQYRNFIKSLLKVYVAYSITGLFLTGILLYIEESIFEIPHYIASLVNLLITIPVNFVLNKFWAYKNSNKQEGDKDER